MNSHVDSIEEGPVAVEPVGLDRLEAAIQDLAGQDLHTLLRGSRPRGCWRCGGCWTAWKATGWGNWPPSTAAAPPAPRTTSCPPPPPPAGYGPGCAWARAPPAKPSRPPEPCTAGPWLAPPKPL